MGTDMNCTKVTPEELAWAEREPEALEDFLVAKDEAAKVSGYVDKGWKELQELLDAEDVEVDLQWDGDFIDESGVHFSWTPKLVASTAELLGQVPFDRLRSHLDPDTAADESSVEYLQGCYKTLVAFFADAADSGSAAILTFSY